MPWMCPGSAQPASRSGVRRPVNVVATTMDLLVELHDKLSPSTIELAMRVLEALTEFVQGPCAANQAGVPPPPPRMRVCISLHSRVLAAPCGHLCVCGGGGRLNWCSTRWLRSWAPS